MPMRVVWLILFWVWSIVGLLVNAFHVFLAHGESQLGVGTSAAISMDILFWIGGSIIFGLGALLTPHPAQ